MKNGIGKHRKHAGSLLIIGGAEEREGDPRILREVVRRTEGGKLCVATLASKVGHEQWESYHRVFRRLGAKKISHLDVVQRHMEMDRRAMAAVEGAQTVFFTGGDQLKITSEIGGTAIADAIFAVYERGGLIAGTSAGASVMSETMLVGGQAETGYQLGEGVKMAPGLGLLKRIIIDQHFSERGRIGRLLGAVAMNPMFLGIGIDENTSIVVQGGRNFHVLGQGSVFVIDAHESTGTNIAEGAPNRCLSISNVKCHVLSEPDWFDLHELRVHHRETAA